MSNIEDYIKKMREKGASDEDVRKSLKDAGWQDEQINNILNDQGDTAPPPPPSAIPQQPVASLTEEDARQLDPKAVWLFFSRYIWSALILLLFLGGPIASLISMLSESSLLMWIVVVAILFIAGAYGWSKLVYKFYKFQLTEDAFKKELGVIRKQYVSIPYDRIQNVDISRGIIARLLGLSEVYIQTAGGSSHGGSLFAPVSGGSAEGKLPGLSQKDAEELREKLISRVHTVKQGL